MTNVTSVYDFVVNDTGTVSHTYGVVMGAGPSFGVPLPANAPAGMKGPVDFIAAGANGAGKFVGAAKAVLDGLIYLEGYNFCKTGKY